MTEREQPIIPGEACITVPTSTEVDDVRRHQIDNNNSVTMLVIGTSIGENGEFYDGETELVQDFGVLDNLHTTAISRANNMVDHQVESGVSDYLTERLSNTRDAIRRAVIGSTLLTAGQSYLHLVDESESKDVLNYASLGASVFGFIMVAGLAFDLFPGNENRAEDRNKIEKLLALARRQQVVSMVNQVVQKEAEEDLVRE